MSRLTGEVWKEYLDIRHNAANEVASAEHKLAQCAAGRDMSEWAQVHATLAVAGRLECRCYLISKMEAPE